MSQRNEIIRAVLRVLLNMDGVPMPEQTLADHVRILVTPAPTISDIAAVRAELEADGLLSGSTDDTFKIVTWTLTTKGEHKAKQIR